MDISRVILFIMAVVIGLTSAHSIGLMNNSRNKEKDDDFEDMFILLGKFELKDQKSFLYKFSLLTWIIYIPYFLLAFNNFYGQIIPFLLTILLIFFVLSDYIIGIRNIKKADDINEAADISKIGKYLTFGNMVVVGVHIAYLL